eukprot:9810441-Alexandrium_andersonii.AAC.1
MLQRCLSACRCALPCPDWHVCLFASAASMVRWTFEMLARQHEPASWKLVWPARLGDQLPEHQ